MIDLPKIKSRIARLKKLEEGFAAELGEWGDSPLLHGEAAQYLNGIQMAVAGLYDARDVLEAVAERLARGPV